VQKYVYCWLFTILAFAWLLSQVSCDYVTGALPSSPIDPPKAPPLDIMMPLPESFISAIADAPGTQWKLVSLYGKPPAGDSYVYLQFADDSSYWGYDGVNYYGGDYVVSTGDSFRFINGMQTLILVEDKKLMVQEDTYLQSFDTIISYHLADRTLTFSDETGAPVLVFRQLPEYAMDPSALDGTKWQLSMVDRFPIPADISVTISFLGDNRADCDAGKYYNYIKYSAKGDDFRITESGVDKKDIDILPELIQSERKNIEYYSKIQYVINFCLTPDFLVFFTLKGEILIFSPL
jgi:heat shock protein HslJ